jgi:hypothetical protein
MLRFSNSKPSNVLCRWSRGKLHLVLQEQKTAKSQLATGQANLNEVIEAKIENYRCRSQAN